MDGTLYYSEDFIDTYIYYLTNDEMLRAEMLEEYKNVTNEFSKPDQQKFVYNDKPLGDLWQILFYIAEKFNISSEANNLAFLKTREKMINGKDRKSTRLNSSHVSMSYAVFCLKKKRKQGRGQVKTTDAR